jgi:hypothetical protein|tara:strand:+ start:495 stop:701 length:207 start_codon:yes stop_codon:yes gene_type:complete
MDLFGQKRKKQETLVDDDEWQNKFYDPLIGAEDGSDELQQFSLGHCGFYETIEESKPNHLDSVENSLR